MRSRDIRLSCIMADDDAFIGLDEDGQLYVSVSIGSHGRVAAYPCDPVELREAAALLLEEAAKVEEAILRDEEEYGAPEWE